MRPHLNGVSGCEISTGGVVENAQADAGGRASGPIPVVGKQPESAQLKDAARKMQREERRPKKPAMQAVSYTHLTLPTKA